MPELPAVEYTRKMIEEKTLNMRVSSVKFTNDTNTPDELIFSEAAAEFVKGNFIGTRVEEVGRWGKQMWILLRNEDLKNHNALLMHLGMTGFVQFEGNGRLEYESSPSRGDPTDIWPPRFTKFIIEFCGDDGKMTKMVFCDARRLGKIDVMSGLCENASFGIIDKFGLGFDPLFAMPPRGEFQKAFAELQIKRKINIKTLLMEQGFVAGLGNWMVDDILMMAGINPKRKLSTLIDTEVTRLHKSIKELTAISVAVDADKNKFPKDWLFHIRWQHGKETLTGLEVKCEKVSGRTTFWVPSLQK